MDPSSYRGLTFLLSLGTLPIACNPEKGDTTDGGTSNTSTGTDRAGSTGSPTSSTSSTTGGATGSGTTGAGTTGGTTDTGGPGSVCEAFVEFQIMCGQITPGTEAEALASCEAFRKEYGAVNGAACLPLFDAYHECVAAATCDAVDPCSAEEDALISCMPEPGAACQAYAAKQVECYPMYGDVAMLAGYCQVYVNYAAYHGGPACGTAVEEYQACLSTLSCAQIEMGVGCDAELAKVDQECMFGDGAAPAGPGSRRRTR